MSIFRCDPLNGHDLRHRFKPTGVVRNKRKPRADEPIFSQQMSLYRCSRCGTRGWVKDIYQGGLLVHQIT